MVLVCHALTGSSRVVDWWGGLAGPGRLLDTDALAIVCVNALGSCYGSTGPGSLAPDGAPYGERFPVVGVFDMVRAQHTALTKLGLERFAAVVGGSLGGMQALAWAIEAGPAVARAVAIGSYDHFSAMGIALGAVAREAIRIAREPRDGIALARKIAMLTYKSEALLDERFGRRPDRGGGDPAKRSRDRYDVEGYLDRQGQLFAARMNPNAYATLSRAMDLFDARGRAIGNPSLELSFVGISSDWLFPPNYVRAAAGRYAAAGFNSRYFELESNHGHDAFLAETDALAELLAPRLRMIEHGLARMLRN